MTTIAEHYIAMRSQAHELRHQQDLDEHVNRRAAQVGGVAAAVAEYFAQFKARVVRSQAEYDAAVAAYRQEMPSLTMQERMQREASFPVPTYPAWSASDEEGYIRTNGDPRQDASLFAQVQILGAPQWNEIIDSRPVTRNKTPWELTVMDALMRPQDGSVGLFPLDQDGNPVIDTSPLLRGTTYERPRLRTTTEPGVGVEDLYGGQAALAGSGWQPPRTETTAPPQAPASALPYSVPSASTPAPQAPPPPAQPPASIPSASMPETVVPAGADASYVRAMSEAAATAMRAICPYCIKTFTRGLPQHMPRCAKNPAVIAEKSQQAVEALAS